ncbi:unnamed protein product [Rotaria sordida]|uniref:Aquaporin n=1 Tax=Rotaria sordida TaxID=392033 RepID=A0A819T8L8_9BILA|nr:unnamed protein product [Rotaria sordida]CAF4077577.1 unnamed protein product [Rotaria sordida]
MTENSPKLVNRVQEPNTNKPDFQWSTDDKLTDQSRNNSAKRHTEMLTRVFHYIVAPPLIKESQRKQHEEEADNDQEFQVDYYEATIQLGRRLLAEILGTILFILVFGSCAIEVGEKRLNREAAAFACGFMALFLAFTLGPISGTHLNPVVTAAFALRFVFPWVWIPFYFLAQFLGSILATLFLKLLYRNGDVSFVLNSPQIPIVDAFIWESFLTCCMMIVILQTSTKGHIIGPQAAFAVASIFIFIGLVGGNKSSVSLNPFRSIGPALIIESDKNKDLWLFIVAPIVGTAVALLICGLLQGFKSKTLTELKSAQGTEAKITTNKNHNHAMPV